MEKIEVEKKQMLIHRLRRLTQIRKAEDEKIRQSEFLFICEHS